jgi:hypothetical protein
MKKIRLNVRELAVESFAVAPAQEPAGRGTVAARESEGETRVGPSCRNCPTEGGWTCLGTCVGDTCGGYCTDYVPSCATCP